MRGLLIALAIGLAAECAQAQGRVWVNPYVREDGVLVRGHYRTAPDNSVYNNWSTAGNVNPYTGEQGTLQPGQTYVTRSGAGTVYYTAPHVYTYNPQLEQQQLMQQQLQQLQMQQLRMQQLQQLQAAQARMQNRSGQHRGGIVIGHDDWMFKK